MSIPIQILTQFPGWDAISRVPQIVIIDVAPIASFTGTGTGKVIVVAETTKGTCNTVYIPADVGELTALFGEPDPSICTKPGVALAEGYSNYEGNLYWWIMNRRYANLGVVRADVAVQTAAGTKETFTLTRVAASTTADGAGVGSTALKVVSTTGLEYAWSSGRNVTVDADHPFTITLAGVEHSIVAVDTATKTLTLSAAASWSGGAAVVRKLDAYTLPGGTVFEGENDAGTEIQVAAMDDVTFAAGTNTATCYARPVSDAVCGEAIGVGSYNGIVDVLTATTSGVTYPCTTIEANGDLSAPYPPGMTLGTTTVSHTGFTCASWAAITNTAYAAAIGCDSAPGGAYSASVEAKDRNVVCSARHWAGDTTSLLESKAIRDRLKLHATDAALVGSPCMVFMRPPLHCDKQTARSASDPGVALDRSDRYVYCYPGLNATIPDLDSTEDIETGFDSWLASAVSQLPAWEHPQQYHGLLNGRGITGVMQIRSTPTGALRDIAPSDYVDFKASGICAPEIDGTHGTTCMNGITNSLTSGRTDIARRRLADYCETGAGNIMAGYKGKLGRTSTEARLFAELDRFFSELKSENNPEFAAIEDYSIDMTSGNTEATRARKIKVIKIKVRALPVWDSFLVYAEIGDTVTVSLEE